MGQKTIISTVQVVVCTGIAGLFSLSLSVMPSYAQSTNTSNATGTNASNATGTNTSNATGANNSSFQAATASQAEDLAAQLRAAQNSGNQEETQSLILEAESLIESAEKITASGTVILNSW